MKVLFVNNKEKRCGVNQFGFRTGQALLKYGKHEYHYIEADTSQEFHQAYNALSADCCIFNFHPQTMGWYDEINPSIKKAAIMHELGFALKNSNFYEALARYENIIWPDPTWTDHLYAEPYDRNSNKIFTVGRQIPEYNPGPAPEELTIGSFGFVYGGKNFIKIIEQVQSEFDSAKIRLHIPAGAHADTQGSDAQLLIEQCKSIIKPNFTLEFSTEFLDEPALLDWLSKNTLNAFFYDYNYGRGITSAVDYALAVKRPIMVTDSFMMRHLFNTTHSIKLGSTTLKTLVDLGTWPLEPYYSLWTQENLANEYDDICNQICI